MRISFKILIINFSIVLLVLGSSAAAFYSLMYNVLSTQQSKFLLDSANDFLYAYREQVTALEEEYFQLTNQDELKNLSSVDLSNKKIDFILYASLDNSIIQYDVKSKVFFSNVKTIQEFFFNNPHVIVNTKKNKDGSVYYYGRIITSELLDEFSKRIRSEIAIIWKSSPSQISNEIINQKYTYSLKKAFSELSKNNNFEIKTQKSETSDLLVTIYSPTPETNISNIQFLIFSSLNSADVLSSSIRDILIIIGFSGVFLAIILTFLFTDKIRKRITDLNKATEVTKLGHFNTRIKVTSNDELGELSGAFNLMLDELERNQKLKNEYAEFITLLNSNPSLSEISNEALKKIILTCGFNIGAIYTIEEENIQIASSFGVDNYQPDSINYELFRSVIKNKEPLQLYLDKDVPFVTNGIQKIHLTYLLILPIIYNNKVISLLEMSGTEKPSEEIRDYLTRIQEQLAIGLTNALAFLQLQKVVSELKKLNDDYQKQNIQIRKQNETLVELHSILKEKADELEVQKEKAEESTKLKSQFLASMSHELRTPMNSILGLSELILADTLFQGKNRERLEVVLKSSRRLMTLINDILDLSKIEAGKVELREEDVVLHDMLKDIEYSVSPLFLNKNVKFRLTKEINSNIVINTDRGKVTQVLINLIGNAVKFTEKGFVYLRVYKNNSMLGFDVIDSGIGISEENQSIIFDEFRQVDGTLAKKYSGTGLGLTICKRIADILCGTIAVNSNFGKGSTFTFSIPLNLTEEISSDVNSKTIIHVIESDQEIRFTIGDYLLGLGYEVIYSEDGESGFVDAIKNQPFAIVLDSNLPNKDGWDIISFIKEDHRTDTIPIILFTVFPDHNVGFGFNVFDFLIDSVDSLPLLNLINKLESSQRKTLSSILVIDGNEEFVSALRSIDNSGRLIQKLSSIDNIYYEIQNTKPELIILNLFIDNQNSIKLFQKLKQDIRTKQIPIVLLLPALMEKDKKDILNNQLVDTAINSKTHPLDVLKIIRDKIRSEEVIAALLGNNTQLNNITSERRSDLFKINPKDKIGEVLVIDDDADTLFTINEILESLNCKTSLAKGGVEGLKILENITPDLILLDIMMPGMDGFQTIRQIKEIPHLAEVPVFAVTAKAMIQDRNIILRNGFSDYIPKPINASMLSEKIRQTLLDLKNE